MTNYKLHALSVGRISGPKKLVTHLVDDDILCTSEMYIWYLEGGDKKIIVDAGVMDADEKGTYNGYPMTNCGPSAVVKALASVGQKPEDIDIVILSHLHFDHAWNIDLFPDAQMVLMKAEYEGIKKMLPFERLLYMANPLEFLTKLEAMNLVLVEDGYEVADGVKLLHCPGHSSGTACTVVSTTAGPHVICSDLFYNAVNIYPWLDKMNVAGGGQVPVTPLPGFPFYPMGSHIDLTDWYNSCWKVLAAAKGKREHLLAGHEPSYAGNVYPLKK